MDAPLLTCDRAAVPIAHGEAVQSLARWRYPVWIKQILNLFAILNKNSEIKLIPECLNDAVAIAQTATDPRARGVVERSSMASTVHNHDFGSIAVSHNVTNACDLQTSECSRAPGRHASPALGA
jgi:hypothetical protein